MAFLLHVVLFVRCVVVVTFPYTSNIKYLMGMHAVSQVLMVSMASKAGDAPKHIVRQYFVCVE